ncbi:hypothetical protein, partial [Vallitalea maricola]|uniref:hypothetical protein n=1 Tax=Vallitalea maricola TaxID=3074433 RepID=UPI0030DDB0AD
FQAEDGIGDWSVVFVQVCVLPFCVTSSCVSYNRGGIDVFINNCSVGLFSCFWYGYMLLHW